MNQKTPTPSWNVTYMFVRKTQERLVYISIFLFTYKAFEIFFFN